MVAKTRRRWGDAEKQAIVAEAARPGTNISAVARRHGIKPSLLFRWRRMAAAEAQSASPVFLPVAVTNGKARGEDAASGDLAPASDAAVHCLADSRIEIELGNGRLVRVGAGVDIGGLEARPRSPGRSGRDCGGALPETLLMIPVPSGVRVDMRRGFPGLALLVQETLKRDPPWRASFVFRGRRGDPRLRGDKPH